MNEKMTENYYLSISEKEANARIEKAIEHLEKYRYAIGMKEEYLDMAITVFEKIQRGELAQVVRCGKCKFKGTSGCATEGFPEDAFCPYGMKRGAE